MKFIVFCLENELTISNLIKLISTNYNIKTTSLRKADFIKSNNTFIFKNQKIIDKILNLKKDFDDIDQVLYFESNPEFIPYFNIIKLSDKSKIKDLNLNKNFILPKYFNNSDYDYYYVIEFNMIGYIKFIQENDTFDENIDKLTDLNNLVSNFDIIQNESVNVILNIISDKNDISNYGKNIECLYDDFIKEIKEKFKNINNDFYRFDGSKIKLCVITNDTINQFLDSEEGKQLLDKYNKYIGEIIEVNKKYINNFSIDYLYSTDIYKTYDRDYPLIISENQDWDDIEHLYETDEGDYYFVIEGDSNRINFVN